MNEDLLSRQTYIELLKAIIANQCENEVTNQKSIYESAVDELLEEVLNDLRILICGIAKNVTKIDLEKSINHKKG